MCWFRTALPDEAGVLLQSEASDGSRLALQAAMWCRSSRRFELQTRLPRIGERTRKSYCICGEASAEEARGGAGARPPASRLGGLARRLGLTAASGRRLVLSLASCSHKLQHEPLRNPAVCEAMRRLLLSVSHPLLVPIEHLDVPPPGEVVVVVREWCEGGSLRDVLHGRAPEGEADAKCAHGEMRRAAAPTRARRCPSPGPPPIPRAPRAEQVRARGRLAL